MIHSIQLGLPASYVPPANLPALEDGVRALIWQSGLFAKLVLLALLLLSVLAWSITLHKYWQFRAFRRDYQRLLNLLRPNAELSLVYAKTVKNRSGPVSRIFEEGYITITAALNPLSGSAEGGMTPHRFSGEVAERKNSLPNDELRMRLETATGIELSQLESGLSFLGTVITASPFLGLLGTVWGVMQAFVGISHSGSAELAVVAPGIAEALITTVAGLAVAVPAVFCYNFLAARLRRIEDDLTRLETEMRIYLTNCWYHEKSKVENRFGHQRDIAR